MRVVRMLAASLLLGACAGPQTGPQREWVGTLDVDGPNAYLNGAHTRDGVRVYVGDRVSTGPATGLKVLLRGGGYVQLDQSTDPDFFREAGCLVVQVLSGRIFVDGSGVCVRGPDFAARQASRVQYATGGGRTQVVVLEGSCTMQRPALVTLLQFDYYTITAGRVDGPPRRLTREQAEGLASWRDNYFRPVVRPVPLPFPQQVPQQVPQQTPQQVPQQTPQQVPQQTPQASPSGYCCLSGGITQTTAARCADARGRFYTDATTARNACQVIR